MKKSDYRDFFAQCIPFLKMSYFLKREGLNSGTFSLFMRGSSHDYCISIDRLERMYQDIIKTCSEKVA